MKRRFSARALVASIAAVVVATLVVGCTSHSTNGGSGGVFGSGGKSGSGGSTGSGASTGSGGTSGSGGSSTSAGGSSAGGSTTPTGGTSAGGASGGASGIGTGGARSGGSTGSGGSAGGVGGVGGTIADAGAPDAGTGDSSHFGPDATDTAPDAASDVAHVPAPATGYAEMKLYDGDPPNLLRNAPAETVAAGSGFIYNVSVPTIRRYPVDESKSTGVVFVVFPGGGYQFVDMETHATALAKLLGPLGFAVFGLKYRIDGGSSNVPRDSLLDANRAIRLVRSHAAEWGLSENHVSVISYSAGSDLDMRLVAGGYDLGNPTATDPVERKSSRPDFVASMCTWANGNSTESYPFTADTPPVYLCHAQDDASAPIAVAHQIDQQLQALHVLDHLEVYPTGGHNAFHVADPSEPGHGWTYKYLPWLRVNNLIPSTSGDSSLLCGTLTCNTTDPTRAVCCIDYPAGAGPGRGGAPTYACVGTAAGCQDTSGGMAVAATCAGSADCTDPTKVLCCQVTDSNGNKTNQCESNCGGAYQFCQTNSECAVGTSCTPLSASGPTTCH